MYINIEGVYMLNARINLYMCSVFYNSTYFVNRNVLRKVYIQTIELRTCRSRFENPEADRLTDEPRTTNKI